MTNKKQPEALRLAEMLTADEWPGSVTLVSYARECVAELRRLHAYCQELESQVIRDCMTHVQKPAGIEHVVGDVLKNGVKLNMTQQPAPATQQAPVRDYPPLPDFDSDDEPIWNAIFNWKTAAPGSEAQRKANTVESVIINQLRAYVDADRAARGAAQAAPVDAAGSEREALRKGLHDAATSLETISLISGRDTYMLHMDQVRGYAAARAEVARGELEDAARAAQKGGAA